MLVIAKVKSHATGFTFILPLNLNKVEYYGYPNFIDEQAELRVLWYKDLNTVSTFRQAESLSTHCFS